MNQFQWQIHDHGLGGSMYCYAGGQKVAEAHGSGGNYNVRIFFDGLKLFDQNINDKNDRIQEVIETYLWTGRWPSGLNTEQDHQDARQVQEDIVFGCLDCHQESW